MTEKKQIDWRIVVVGLICLTALEGFAIYKGINGILLTGVIAIIAAAVGVALPQLKTK